MNRICTITLFLYLILTSISVISVSAKDYLITDFGAKGDGKTLNTEPIQKAIDKVSQIGGRIVFPEGVYLSGSLIVKSNVEIHIE